MRVSSAASGRRLLASESGDFCGIFAVQLHGKVRAYDAPRGGDFLTGGSSPGPGVKAAALRLFGTQNAYKAPADDGRVQTCGALNPTFRIIYREAQ